MKLNPELPVCCTRDLMVVHMLYYVQKEEAWDFLCQVSRWQISAAGKSSGWFWAGWSPRTRGSASQQHVAYTQWHHIGQCDVPLWRTDMDSANIPHMRWVHTDIKKSRHWQLYSWHTGLSHWLYQTPISSANNENDSTTRSLNAIYFGLFWNISLYNKLLIKCVPLQSAELKQLKKIILTWATDAWSLHIFVFVLLHPIFV